jgi:hypothetical protein
MGTFVRKRRHLTTRGPKEHERLSRQLHADRFMAKLLAFEKGMPMICHTHGSVTRSGDSLEKSILTIRQAVVRCQLLAISKLATDNWQRTTVSGIAHEEAA